MPRAYLSPLCTATLRTCLVDTMQGGGFLGKPKKEEVHSCAHRVARLMCEVQDWREARARALGTVHATAMLGYSELRVVHAMNSGERGGVGAAAKPE
jgi:hypothetical protein